MNQPAAQALYQKLQKEGPVTEDALIKTATSNGLSTAQLGMLAQIHNSANTIRHLRQNTDNGARGSEFDTIDVAALTAKYASQNVPLKNHPPEAKGPDASADYPGLNVRIIDATGSNQIVLKSASTQPPAVNVTHNAYDVFYPVDRPKQTPRCSRCRSDEVKLAADGNTQCEHCGHGLPDELRGAIQCKQATVEVDGYLKGYEAFRDEMMFMRHESAKAITGISEQLRVKIASGVKFHVLHEDVKMAEVDPLAEQAILALVKTASDVEHDPAKHGQVMLRRDRTSLLQEVVKLAASIREHEDLSRLIENCDTVMPQLRDMQRWLGSGEVDAADSWASWKQQKLSAVAWDDDADTVTQTPPPKSKTDVNPDNIQAIHEAAKREEEAKRRESSNEEVLMEVPAGSDTVGSGSGDEPPPQHSGHYFTFLQPLKRPDDKAPVAKERVGSSSPSVSLLDTLKQVQGMTAGIGPERRDTTGLRNGVRDARTAMTIARLMRSDDIIAEASPDRVIALANELLDVSPEIGQNPERLRSALREAIGYDATTADSLSQQAKLTEQKQKNSTTPSTPTKEVK